MQRSGRRSVTTGRGRVAAFRGRFVSLATLAVVAVVGISACSSSSSTGGTGTPATAGATGGATATGPIKIAVGEEIIAGAVDATKMIPPALNAAAGYINAHGGWGGRTVTFDYCSSPSDPASDQKCFRQFIANHDLASIAGLVSGGTTGLSELTAAGIPSVGTADSVPQQTSPWQVTLSSDLESALTVPAEFACARGYKNVSVAVSDLPIIRADFALFPAGIYKSCGISTHIVYVPLAAVDPAPYIQKAIGSKPDLLVDDIIGLPPAEVVSGITSAGFPMSKTFFATLNPTSSFLADPKISGAVLGSGSDLPLPQDTAPDVQAYLQAMKQYSPGADPTPAFAQQAFVQLLTIWQVGKAIGFGKLTGQTLQQYMLNQAPGHLKVFMGRVVSLDAKYPGMKQPYFHIVQWTGQQLVSLGWWNAYSPCSSQASCAAGMKAS